MQLVSIRHLLGAPKVSVILLLHFDLSKVEPAGYTEWRVIHVEARDIVPGIDGNYVLPGLDLLGVYDSEDVDRNIYSQLLHFDLFEINRHNKLFSEHIMFEVLYSQLF